MPVKKKKTLVVRRKGDRVAFTSEVRGEAIVNLGHLGNGGSSWLELGGLVVGKVWLGRIQLGRVDLSFLCPIILWTGNATNRDFLFEFLANMICGLDLCGLR